MATTTIRNTAHTRKQTRTPGISGIWLVALGAALWGSDTVLRQPLLQWFSATEIVFLEHCLLALYAIPVLLLNRAQLQGLTLKQWGAVLFIAWGGSGLATTLFTAAFQYGNPTVVLLLQKVQPIIVFLMARFLLQERLPKKFGLDLLIALIGTYLLTFGFSFSFQGGTSQSAAFAGLLAIGAAALWGGSTVMGRILLDKMEFQTVTGLRFLVALPFMGLLVLTSHANVPHMFSAAAAWQPFVLLLGQALLPGILSLLLYYRGLSNVKASYATLAELSFPAAGVLLGWVFFHQALTLGQFLGFAIIWIVVFRLTMYAEKESKR